ncbi:MAG: sulfate reduction electron transfer complex DsrMKJOP subunit DsrO [Thermodesulfobacteriota bacterium]
MNTTRRKFLKLAGLTALGWSLRPSILMAASNSATGVADPGDALHAKRWAMTIDTKALTEEIMQKCIDICNKIHNIPQIDSDEEIKWIWTAPFEHLCPGQVHKRLMEMPEENSLSLCNHCDNPPCVRVCPTKATFQRDDGIVMMDFHRCIGCRYCMAACPYGSRSFNFSDPRNYLKDPTPDFPTRTKGVVEKCEFCSERLAEGKLPACVEVSEGALKFGDLDDPHSDVSKALENRYSIRRKPELGTEPCVYYLI